MKDLRDLNEEEFKQVYEYVKEKTNNFTEFSADLIIENNQYLFIIRMCLCLSQKEFANRVGNTGDWCRHLEAKRNKIVNLTIARRYNNKIEKILQESEISFDKALEFYNRFNLYSKDHYLPEPEIKFKTFSQMNEEDVVEYFNIIKKETKNFTEFKTNLLLRIPQSLVIFRIVLCLSYRRFSELTGISERQIGGYEHLKMKIKPVTSKKLITIIKDLFKNINKKEINIDKVLENFRILSGFYGPRNLESALKDGITRFAKINPNKFEDEIADLLSKNKIPYKRYDVMNGIKRDYNVDFLIEYNNKKIILEVFSYGNLKKRRKNIKTKVCLVDHRFQSLKKINQNLVTIMCIKITGKPILLEYVKKYFSIELLNTDYLLINHEIENLPKIIKNLLSLKHDDRDESASYDNLHVQPS